MRQQKLDETAVVASASKNSALPTVPNLNNVRDIEIRDVIQQPPLHNVDYDGVLSLVDDEIRHSLELYTAADENYNYTKSSPKRATHDCCPYFINNQSARKILAPVDSTSDLSGLFSFESGEDLEYCEDMERYIDSENNTYEERFVGGSVTKTAGGFFPQNLGLSRGRNRTQTSQNTSLRDNWKIIIGDPMLSSQQQQEQLTAVAPSSKKQLSPMTTSSISDLMTSSFVTSMMTSTDDGSSLVSTDDNLWETGDVAGEQDSMGASVYAASSVSAFSDSDFCDITNPGKDGSSNYFERSEVAAINSQFSHNKFSSVPMEYSYSEKYTGGECFGRNDVTPTPFSRLDQNYVTPSGSDDDFAQRSESTSHYNDIVWKSNRKKLQARKRAHGNERSNAGENNNNRSDSKGHASYRETCGSGDDFGKIHSGYLKQTSSTKKSENATEFHPSPANRLLQRSSQPSRINTESTHASTRYERDSFKDDLKRNSYVDMWRMNSASPVATRYNSQFHHDDVAVTKKQTASYLKRNGMSLTDPDFFEDQRRDVEDFRPADDTKRSLARISSGLARNVTVLRERKQLMSDVFGPALAEERIRVRELKRFQREALEARKRVLLETLADLKNSLAGQAQRLQGAYDTVLSRQYVMMKSGQISAR